MFTHEQQHSKDNMNYIGNERSSTRKEEKQKQTKGRSKRKPTENPREKAKGK